MLKKFLLRFAAILVCLSYFVGVFCIGFLWLKPIRDNPPFITDKCKLQSCDNDMVVVYHVPTSGYNYTLASSDLLYFGYFTCTSYWNRLATIDCCYFKDNISDVHTNNYCDSGQSAPVLFLIFFAFLGSIFFSILSLSIWVFADQITCCCCISVKLFYFV